MENKTLPRMCTIREIAKMGILPEGTLRRLCKDGRIPFVTVGNTMRVNLDILIALLSDPNSTLYQ